MPRFIPSASISNRNSWIGIRIDRMPIGPSRRRCGNVSERVYGALMAISHINGDDIRLFLKALLCLNRRYILFGTMYCHIVTLICSSVGRSGMGIILSITSQHNQARNKSIDENAQCILDHGRDRSGADCRIQMLQLE